jgi:pyrimidine-nucleoside phosphorylase
MNPVQIITKKRDGGALSPVELRALVEGYARGDVPDYQMAAWAMAVFLRGMTDDETATLTEAMLDSGARLEWPADLVTVDKHSTGGIGDKTSLVLAPLLATFDLAVPMISGRGLGATGGTLDKLEAIPGFRTNLSLDEIRAVTRAVGCVITGATADLVPADRKLYALRDVTATVASIPLITASIMSKKLAEGLSALVLDVKFGSGAFMKTADEARRLARSMVAVGRKMDVKTTALLTDMNQPLGRMAGNGVEVVESVDVLRGGGPPDLVDLTLALGAELLVATGRAADRDAAVAAQRTRLADGTAYEKFRAMIDAQGGDLDAPRERAPESLVAADRTGHISAIDTEALGWAVIELGGGRKVLTDKVDPAVGLEMLVRLGDNVKPGDPLVRMFAKPGPPQHAASAVVRRAITIADVPPATQPLILERVE